MAKLDLQPHKYREIKKGSMRGRKVVDYDHPNAYIRISSRDHGELFIQKGHLMDAGGTVIPHDQVPDWAMAEIMKQSPEALREAGYNVREVLVELEKKAKEKSKIRDAGKKKAAQAAAMAKARAAKQAKQEERMPDDPEPEDVNLPPEDDEDAAE